MPRPGHAVLMAVDLGGRFRDPFPWWDASTDASDQHLREICRSCPLAARACSRRPRTSAWPGPSAPRSCWPKSSRVGLEIDLDRRAGPKGRMGALASCLPSFGFVLTAPQDHVPIIITHFEQAGSLAPIGAATADRASACMRRRGGHRMVRP
jgi:selenophosphate synthetase-related protein